MIVQSNDKIGRAMLNLFRPALSRVITPVGRALARTGLRPDTITVVGTLGVVGGALGFYPRGELFWGSVVVTVFVFADMLDGAVARVIGVSGPWGAFLDSTMDRLGDAAIFSGLILWFAGDDMLITTLALFCLVAGALVSYAKARAEGLGLTCDVGIAERGERLIVVLVATGLSGLGVPYVLPAGLWLLAVASVITVIQRVMIVRRQVTERAPGGGTTPEEPA